MSQVKTKLLSKRAILAGTSLIFRIPELEKMGMSQLKTIILVQNSKNSPNSSKLQKILIFTKIYNTNLRFLEKIQKNNIFTIFLQKLYKKKNEQFHNKKT